MQPADPGVYGFAPLHVAARDGDWSGVMAALTAGAALDERVGPVRNDKLWSREGATALHLAAEGGHGQVCALLIDRGLSVHDRDVEDRTPLHYACRGGRSAAVVGTLLGEGADPNAAAWTGETPLFAALRTDDVRAVVVLLRRGADATVVAHRTGLTPLHVAAARGEESLARMLVEHGADRSVPDRLGRTPADSADERDHPELAKWLRGERD